MNAITPTTKFTLQPATNNKNSVSHLNKYNRWCSYTGQDVLQPDLAEYRDYLQQNLSASSVRVHLSHIRQSYRQVILNRDMFYQMIPSKYAGSISDQKAYVDEWITRIEAAIRPEQSQVKVVIEQDTEDDKHLRLTKQQASDYLNSFGTSSLKRLRNTCIVGLMLCTGIREAELAGLEVDDLRQQFGGDLALRVKVGKGAKKRLIPYGQLSWVLVLIDKYLERANIQSCRVFNLSTRQIQNIVKSKPVNVNGGLKIVRPHDLRRTYAKLLYLEGMNLVAIKDNLGHSSIKTTEKYIGVLDSKERQPSNIYQFDLGKL